MWVLRLPPVTVPTVVAPPWCGFFYSQFTNWAVAVATPAAIFLSIPQNRATVGVAGSLASSTLRLIPNWRPSRPPFFPPGNVKWACTCPCWSLYPHRVGVSDAGCPDPEPSGDGRIAWFAKEWRRLLAYRKIVLSARCRPPFPRGAAVVDQLGGLFPTWAAILSPTERPRRRNTIIRTSQPGRFFSKQCLNAHRDGEDGSS